jgi:hypothetical protein
MVVGRHHPDRRILVMPLSTDASAYEHSLELSTQELTGSPACSGMLEIEDICDVDPLLRTGTFAANADCARIDETAGSVEIELSAEQVVGELSR